MNKAVFIANYIIQYCNDQGYEINNLKLQKILYFLQARFLFETNQLCFLDTIEKWQYGPVVPNVYHEFKSFGAYSISNDGIVNEIISLRGSNSGKLEVNIEVYDSASINGRDRIENTVDALNSYSAFELVDLTHKHLIWKNFEKDINAGVQHISYTNDELREYFANHKEARIWEVN